MNFQKKNIRNDAWTRQERRRVKLPKCLCFFPPSRQIGGYSKNVVSAKWEQNIWKALKFLWIVFLHFRLCHKQSDELLPGQMLLEPKRWSSSTASVDGSLIFRSKLCQLPPERSLCRPACIMTGATMVTSRPAKWHRQFKDHIQINGPNR